MWFLFLIAKRYPFCDGKYLIEKVFRPEFGKSNTLYIYDANGNRLTNTNPYTARMVKPSFQCSGYQYGEIVCGPYEIPDDIEIFLLIDGTDINGRYKISFKDPITESQVLIASNRFSPSTSFSKSNTFSGSKTFCYSYTFSPSDRWSFSMIYGGDGKFPTSSDGLTEREISGIIGGGIVLLIGFCVACYYANKEYRAMVGNEVIEP